MVGRDVAGRPVADSTGVWANVSHTDGPLPSAFAAPSIWYADVAAPHQKPSGKAGLGGAEAFGVQLGMSVGALAAVGHSG